MGLLRVARPVAVACASPCSLARTTPLASARAVACRLCGGSCTALRGQASAAELLAGSAAVVFTALRGQGRRVACSRAVARPEPQFCLCEPLLAARTTLQA